MIESCTKRQMLLGITLLGGLTVLVLIVESHWTETTSSKPYIENFENNSACATNEEVEVISECQPCTAFEIASKSIGVCAHARYKEIIKCKDGETITRSCDKVAWLEERTFWKFEGFMLLLAVLSCSSVFWRENILRQRIIRRVARQLRVTFIMTVAGIYLKIFSLTDICKAPIETIIALFTIKYCDSTVNIKLIECEQKLGECGYTVDLSSFVYKILSKEKVPDCANSCELPNILVNERSCIAGLCACLRQIVKSAIDVVPSHHCQTLLGFKNSCLLACSEVSVWTRFCEVDLISTLRSFGNEMLDQSELPISMAKFEIHMSQPARLHNLYKYTMSKKYAISGNINRDNKFLPEHTFAEGSCITLADIIIFVCIHILFNLIPLTSDKILELLPLTMTWYKKMIENDAIIKCLTCLPLQEIDCDNVINYVLPAVDNQSLYKSDSKRYRPRSRIYTRQEDIEHSLELVENLNVNTKLNDLPFGAEICIDWSSIPFDATPEGGSLPVARQKRKLDQLENLCRPVIKLAKKGDVIVDFCSGSGHLGITLAYLLPECSVILLENKEESLNRAKERGHFDIGTSLHACGVATDLVIQHCIRKNATFVCCPCCYGSVQSCQRVVYPRSNVFQKDIAIRDYLVLGHAADQTHDAGNSKTLQGKKCMTIIDTDRKLHAEQFGYNVQLAKLVPEDCTPKNHLLVGIPENGVCKC